MIRLKPILEIPATACPNCHLPLTAKDFVITGMRNLADFLCSNCGGEFYGDLPAGQALFTPILLDKKSGAVFDNYNAAWFSDWLANAYKQRKDEPLRFDVRKFSQIKGKVILLNCLDSLYGHSLLKLLNAQYYIDRQPDFSLIVLVPPFLEWMLPAGIAEAWIIGLPLRRGTEWNDWLGREISERVESFSQVFLSVAFSHPHFEDFEIERFTRVTPFALENFEEFQNEPIITFIWREDRLWESENNPKPARFRKLKSTFGFTENLLDEQTRKIIRFAESLRGEFPRLDFAVAGLGTTNEFPSWITDLRLTKLSAKAERRWCERYAASHVVLGVHGSNMLLPSAHAGSVVELFEEERQGNFLQDILFRRSDAREMLFRYRFVPHSTAPEMLAQIVSTMLRYKHFRRLISPEFCRHREKYDLENWLTKKRGQTEVTGKKLRVRN